MEGLYAYSRQVNNQIKLTLRPGPDSASIVLSDYKLHPGGLVVQPCIEISGDYWAVVRISGLDRQFLHNS